MNIPGAVVSGYANPRDMRSNQSGGRLSRGSATVLSLLAYNGEVVEVNDENVPLGAGISTTVTTENVIDANGADSGAVAVPATTYGVFLSNSRHSSDSLRNKLRLGPTTVTASATSAQSYLGGSGDAANWRLLGYARCIDAGAGVPNLVDTASQRFVANLYNQVARTVFARPGYSNDNAQTNVNTVAAAWAPLNGGTGDLVEWLADGVYSVHLSLSVPVLLGPAAVSMVGIALNSTTQPNVSAVIAAAAANVTPACSHVGIPGAGYNYASAMVMAAGAGLDWIADTGRNGAAADVPGAMLCGIVFQ